jgi:signal transduction histidine kinase
MVSVDPHQIEQVLVNVVKNAIESIGEDGTITIRATAGETIVLRIIDDGKGIPDSIKPHLFTPFYSTKREGQGIGLTLTREILINHGFRFNLETTAPEQTEFWIDFGPSAA